MSETGRILHVTYGEGMSSVFLSQVIRPMAAMSRRGYEVSSIAFAPLGQFLRSASRAAWHERARSIRDDFGLEVDRLPLPPSRASGLWRGDGLFKAWLKRRLRREGRVVIHCRGTAAANMAIRATRGDARCRVIFDCRGLEGPEHLYVRGYRSETDAPAKLRAQSTEADDAQRRAAVHCHAMVCVSEAMKQEVESRWSVPRCKMTVIPCCTDVAPAERVAVDRAAARDRLGLGSRFVVAYCGSLEAWQMPEESLAVFNTVARLRPNAHFMAITTHPTRMESIAEEAGIGRERRTIVAVPHTEVPAFLACADAGLLVREDSPVNRVASPVKFAEYLACAVPVILSQGIGDYSALVEREGIGCVLPFPSRGEPEPALERFIERQARDPDGLRTACLAVARRSLDWNAGAQALGELYRGVLNQERVRGGLDGE